jgi:peptide deformylase
MERTFLPFESPMLRQVAAPVTAFGTDELRALVADMFDTMRSGRGVGLAAPQIGISQRIVVLEFPGGERAPGEAPVPPTALINPVITSGDGAVEDIEGCFSVPGKRGYVTRHSRISYLAYDVDGNEIGGEARGFHARIIQHEIDHLNGVLYVDIANRTEPWDRTTTQIRDHSDQAR